MTGSRRGDGGKKPGGFEGFKVLWAALVGGGIGVVLAIFLDTFISHTPADLPSGKLRYLYGVVVASVALFGGAIESMRQLQEGSPEADYHRRRRRR